MKPLRMQANRKREPIPTVGKGVGIPLSSAPIGYRRALSLKKGSSGSVEAHHSITACFLHFMPVFIDGFTRRDSEAAAQFASTLSDGQGRDELTKRIASTWARSDPAT